MLRTLLRWTALVLSAAAQMFVWASLTTTWSMRAVGDEPARLVAESFRFGLLDDTPHLVIQSDGSSLIVIPGLAVHGLLSLAIAGVVAWVWRRRHERRGGATP